MAVWARGSLFFGVVGLITCVVGGAMMWQTRFDTPGGAGNVATGLFVLTVGGLTLLLSAGWTAAVMARGAEHRADEAPEGPVLEEADVRVEPADMSMDRG